MKKPPPNQQKAEHPNQLKLEPPNRPAEDEPLTEGEDDGYSIRSLRDLLEDVEQVHSPGNTEVIPSPSEPAAFTPSAHPHPPKPKRMAKGKAKASNPGKQGVRKWTAGPPPPPWANPRPQGSTVPPTRTRQPPQCEPRPSKRDAIRSRPPTEPPHGEPQRASSSQDVPASPRTDARGGDNMQFFLAWGTAWRLYFTKAEFTVYEQLDYSAKFQICEGKARLQYQDGLYDQTKNRFRGKRGGGAITYAPLHPTAVKGEPGRTPPLTTPPGTQLLPVHTSGRKPLHRLHGGPCLTPGGGLAAEAGRWQGPPAHASPPTAAASQATPPRLRALERPGPTG